MSSIKEEINSVWTSTWRKNDTRKGWARNSLFGTCTGSKLCIFPFIYIIMFLILFDRICNKLWASYFFKIKSGRTYSDMKKTSGLQLQLKCNPSDIFRVISRIISTLVISFHHHLSVWKRKRKSLCVAYIYLAFGNKEI